MQTELPFEDDDFDESGLCAYVHEGPCPQDLREAVQMALEPLERDWAVLLDAGTLAAVLRTSWVPREGTQHLHAALMRADDNRLYAVARPILLNCPDCGHVSVDHAEGLRCHCGCGGLR